MLPVTGRIVNVWQARGVVNHIRLNIRLSVYLYWHNLGSSHFVPLSLHTPSETNFWIAQYKLSLNTSSHFRGLEHAVKTVCVSVWGIFYTKCESDSESEGLTGREITSLSKADQRWHLPYFELDDNYPGQSQTPPIISIYDHLFTIFLIYNLEN